MPSSGRTFRQVLRFLAVSAISIGIDYAIYFVLTGSFDINASWAKRISFACIAVWAFFAHRRFTFHSRSRGPRVALCFGFLYLTGWALNSLVHDLVIGDARNAPHSPALVTATAIWACWNFLGQKYFVFRKAKALPRQERP